MSQPVPGVPSESPSAPPPAPPPGWPGPPRSRSGLVPHLVWEGILLVLVVIVMAVAAARVPLFDGPVLAQTLATVGLLAAGLALSLRLATPNLALPGLASLAGVGYAWSVTDAELPPAAAAAGVLLAMALVGLFLGLIAGLVSAPAWAVSLGALVIAQGLAVAIVGSPQGIPTEPLVTGAGLWLALFLVGSVGGGVVLAVPEVQRRLGDRLVRDRTADPVRFDPARLLTALVGFGGSTVLAALAGLASASLVGYAVPELTIYSLFPALAAVLIGGVSGFGGRGGVAGTALGATLVSTLSIWLLLEGGSTAWPRLLVLGGLVLLGLGVSRLLEAFTGPASSARLARPG